MDRYVHRFYGPSSGEVDSALEEMAAFFLLDKRALSGLYESYSYSLTDSGRRYADKTGAGFPHGRRSIAETVRICKERCDLRPSPLSYAAKSYHIPSNAPGRARGRYSARGTREVGAGFDWDFKEDAPAGAGLLEGLDLILPPGGRRATRPTRAAA